MLSASQCQRQAGLSSHEVVLGVSPTEKHERLLASYMLNIVRGERFVFEMIVADVRGFIDLGALDYAGDTFIVLRRFLDSRPHLRRMRISRREQLLEELVACESGGLWDRMFAQNGPRDDVECVSRRFVN